MRVEISGDGRLSILSESGVEAYALKKWYEEQFNNLKNPENRELPNMVFYFGESPEASRGCDGKFSQP